ncbi:MAG: microcystin-dependent protein [Saprospiraceae bacterium]|jgi:microcystin-dependent protein|tara:strand:- start:499 stop:1014 length:516 start_codon:yes stop_codon:yes gene_type:complete
MEPFLGQILLFAGNFAPRGWALCEGQLLPINQYQALFSILGTTYGGDGRTSFGLPDLRGRAPISQGNGAGLPSYNLGQKGGNATTTLTTANLPVTQVSIPSSSNEGNSPEPSGSVPAVSTEGAILYKSGTAAGSMKPGSIVGAANISYSNQSPYLAMNYIVALQGVFPSRN